MHLGILTSVVLSLAALSVILTAWYYPRHKDLPAKSPRRSPSRDFYDGAYDNQPVAATDNDDYVSLARAHARRIGIPEAIKTFIENYGLTAANALEVGCGSGLLQGFTDRYVGIDLSLSVRRFFHQPFVQASAVET